MILPFLELPYYQEFVHLSDSARRTQMVQDYCNLLIKACDWTQIPFAPVDAEVWRTYREELKNYTTTYDPNNIEPVFPTAPQIVLNGDNTHVH